MRTAIFGSTDDAERLYIPQLTNVKASEDALIHAFSYQGIHVDWVLDRMLHGKVVAYRWIGLAVNRATKVSSGEMDRIFRQLVKTFDNGDMNQNLIRDAVISLGLLCDRHAQGSVKADEAMCREAEREIKALDDKYPWVTAWEKAKAVSLKLICDETLSEDDEQYLLSLYEE